MNEHFRQIVSELIPLRRRFHEIPELGYQEFETTALIAQYLYQNGMILQPFNNLKTGGFCDVGSGDIIAFRSDIDALPITEDQEHQVRSQKPGVMHACGHDFHIAIGLALLRYFKLHEERLNFRLRVIFQPAEESVPGGATDVVKENIWQNVKVLLTAHVLSDFTPGKIVLSEKTANASSTSAELTFYGPGGHTSRPDETVDLISVVAAFITQVNNYLHEHVDPRNPFVLVFGEIKGGSAHNIIPREASLRGTIRTFDNTVNKQIVSLLQQYCNDYSNTYKIKIKLNFPSTCPAVINDSRLMDIYRNFIASNDSTGNFLVVDKPAMGADDFSYYLEKAPGLYFRIGAGASGSGHCGAFIADENLLIPGSEGLIRFIEYLSLNI
jgi:amidohydrolase